MTKHTELIARLEAAEVGSYLLDAALGKAVGYYVPDTAWAGWHDMDGKHVGMVPTFTTSLDAALALAERVLGVEAALELLHKESAVTDTVKILPLDLCIAILKALDAKHD